jgi:hypothetical protein
MNLDELLSQEAAVPPLNPAKFSETQALIEAAAHQDVARLARIHRLRRGRRLLMGVAAAAVAGVVITTQSTTSPDLDTSIGTYPNVRTADFKTVAQVTNAALAATADADPTAAPYWKVVSTYQCTTTAANAPQSGRAACQHTVWEGNGRPGVVEDSAFAATAIPAATVTIGGQTMTWRQANAQSWTDAQISALVADDGPANKPGGRAPTGWYVFKNTGDLLANAPASAPIRRQLWRQLASVPGVKLAGRAKDSRGRSGWLLTLKTPGYGNQSYVVDTATGMLLEQVVRLPHQDPSVFTLVSAGPAQAAPSPAPEPTPGKAS